MNFSDGRLFALVFAAAYGKVGLVEIDYNELTMGNSLVGSRIICGSPISINPGFEGQTRSSGKMRTN